MEREKVSYEELEKAYLDQVEHTNLVRESYVEMLKKLDVTHESLKSRLAAFEAALSLSAENVERVADHPEPEPEDEALESIRAERDSYLDLLNGADPEGNEDSYPVLKRLKEAEERIAALEAALSLSAENVEKVRTEISEIRDWPTYSEAESAIKAIRKLIGMEA